MSERGSDHVRSFAASAQRNAAVAKIARIAIHDCAGVRSGETVLIVTDNAGDPELADLLAHEARSVGAEVVVIGFGYVQTILEIPERVSAAIRASDVVIPVCQSRILYSAAIKAARERGRILYMADFPTEMLMRPVVQLADYGALAAYGEAFPEIFAAGGELRVTTPAGTDATMQMLPDRRLSISTCRVRGPGERDYLPGGAWFGCPDETSVNGTFVIDCSMEPGVVGGVVEEPVRMTFVRGAMVELAGGDQAEEFRSWLESCDEMIWNVSHNGGGFNAHASRIGNLMEDERILGSFNIAGGNNQSGWPGSNASSFHWDAMMLQATYSLDGVPICERGEWVHPRLVAIAEKMADDVTVAPHEHLGPTGEFL